MTASRPASIHWVEVQAPAGFVLASEIEFIVEETGEVQTVEMTDKQVIVSKKAITGEDELLARN